MSAWASGTHSYSPWDTVRDRFLGLTRLVNGHRLAYLDSAATTLRPEAVLLAEARAARDHGGSPHRGPHTLAAEATALFEGCRAVVARWLGAPVTECVVIARGATAALNLVARGLEHRLRRGDEVLLTEMEHHANLVPWLQLAARSGVVLRFLPVTAEGHLDLEALPRLLTKRTKVVSLTHASNVLGTLNPVRLVADAAHDVGATVVVDAAQSAGRLPLSFADLGADLLVVSAHKCYGPMGLGFLLGTHAALDALEPLEGGGSMISEVYLDRAEWADVPWRFEAGTPDVPAAAAFPVAVRLLDELGPARVRAHELDLLAYALEGLGQIPGLRVLGPRRPGERVGVIGFFDPRIHAHDLATLVDRRGVALRAGHHCAQPLHRRLGITASARASFGVYSERRDVDQLVEALETARRVMGR